MLMNGLMNKMHVMTPYYIGLVGVHTYMASDVLPDFVNEHVRIPNSC